MKWIAALVFFQIHLINLSSQILINELSSTNNKWISDGDNEYPDWIELYNAYDTSVNLINWSISDSPLPNKWVFPNILFPVHRHLLFGFRWRPSAPPTRRGNQNDSRLHRVGVLVF